MKAETIFPARNPLLKSPPTQSTHEYQRPINVPPNLYQKLIDFLEDKRGSRITRRKNAFYIENQPGRPIAWLNSQVTVTIVLKDHWSNGNWSTTQIRIQDIKLPTVIRIEHRVYESLLCQLIRSSNGGVVRWFNKFYSTKTGMVLAELVSQDKVKLFDSHGLFEVPKIVDLNSYAAIEIPRETFIHLLTFLEQQECEEVTRIGNEFYPKAVIEVVRTALKSPATVEQNILEQLNTKLLAKVISKESVRLKDDKIKRISELVLTKKVYKDHLYFCNSCQSFIRIPYRTTVHKESRSETHSLTYIRSSLVIVPLSKKVKVFTNKTKNSFSERIHRFWGMEKGGTIAKRQSNSISKRTRKHFSLLAQIPISKAMSPLEQRNHPSGMLLFLAEIRVDGHVVTGEEKESAFRRLREEEEEETN
jgi:hypothetical protein